MSRRREKRGPLRELIFSLYGVWRLFSNDELALAFFDLSLRGLWRSFYVAALAFPLFMLEWASGNAVFERFDPTHETAPFAVDLTIYLLAWPAGALVLVGCSWLVSRTERFFVLVIAMNWMYPYILLALFVTEVVILAGPDIFIVFLFTMHALIVCVEYRVVRIALDARPLSAVAALMIINLCANVFPELARRAMTAGLAV